ncbi:hypothetical protein D4T97_008310 [Siminovitchia acidinfaciens]|uniref:Uncharacterized protein n=1 Tax=Siminovitchia acidinfaciens TaxID=2321395 RepID=A0A429Y203_9BACI|nr:hypothetical protein [Siminovitchia acidinfaciens]RST75248.1 hypothetical protein D4T97_008310 [Siminovitchia acidinfaciens]
MGYIAPIRMLEYSEYQKRVQEKSKNHDPMPVNFTPRIRLQSKLYWGTNREGIPLKLKEKKQYGSPKSSVIDKKLPEETGKGRYINEYV